MEGKTTDGGLPHVPGDMSVCMHDTCLSLAGHDRFGFLKDGPGKKLCSPVVQQVNLLPTFMVRAGGWQCMGISLIFILFFTSDSLAPRVSTSQGVAVRSNRQTSTHLDLFSQRTLQ